MTASGGCAAAAVSASLGRRGSVDGVPGAAQRGAQRAQDLRFVVDDEDALAGSPLRQRRLHAWSSAGISTTGSASANVAP